MKLQRLLKIARPKFWHYTAGPFAFGVLALLFVTPIWQWNLNGEMAGKIVFLALAFIWFLLAGNFFIYGINDLADEETDALNSEKKNDQDEALLKKSEHTELVKFLWVAVFSGAILWLAGVFLGIIGWISLVAWLAFMFFSWGYSCEPIRAKKRPFLDGIFNILYVLPGVTAFGVVGWWADWRYVLAGTLWCMAMHAFSAIPDIEADRQVGLKTTAVKLGSIGTLYYCLACYGLAWIIFYHVTVFELFWRVILSLYIILMGILISRAGKDVKKVYKIFPWINLLMGGLIFIITLYCLTIWAAIS